MKTLTASVLALAFLLPAAGHAGVLGVETPQAPAAATAPAPTAFAGKEPQQKLFWGQGSGKSYVVPAFEIVTFEFLFNQYDRHTQRPNDDYLSNSHTIRDNLQRRWVVDNDPFSINQFGHPYQGTIYHGFARSAGLGYWQALAYDHAGSFLWEIAGEKTPPSINDQIATGFGGSFLGEPLFRMASLMLETASGKPGFWRELGATFLSPPTGLNRYASDRFDGVFQSHDPAVYTRVQAGAAVTDTATGRSPTAQFNRNQAYAEVVMEYGLPGKEGYTYERPFDYFNFQFTASSSNTFESILSRGLLAGQAYENGDNYRGIWGLFGTYDYIAPQVFRVGSTGASVGTVGQWWLSQAVALEATAMAGVGYAGGGITEHTVGFRDYHYGLTPQELLSFRMVFGSRVAWDFNLRDYYITGVASTENGGSENISRADTSLTWRVYGLHGITLKYAASQRDARYPDNPAQHQRVSTVSLAYTLLGSTRFGAVDWRPSALYKEPDKM